MRWHHYAFSTTCKCWCWTCRCVKLTHLFSFKHRDWKLICRLQVGGRLTSWEAFNNRYTYRWHLSDWLLRNVGQIRPSHTHTHTHTPTRRASLKWMQPRCQNPRGIKPSHQAASLSELSEGIQLGISVIDWLIDWLISGGAQIATKSSKDTFTGSPHKRSHSSLNRNREK